MIISFILITYWPPIIRKYFTTNCTRLASLNANAQMFSNCLSWKHADIICLVCKHWFLDSVYPNTANSDLKPFSSQNACSAINKRLSDFFLGITARLSVLILVLQMSQCMRFPTMWYVRPAKPQISLRIRSV